MTPAIDHVGPIRAWGGCLSQGPVYIGNSPDDIDLQFFTLEVVQPPPFHRVGAPTDVNGDGELTSADAFAVINLLSRNGGTIELDSAAAGGLNPNLMVNVSPDQRISAQDALRVVNALERQGTGGSGESEQSDDQVHHESLNAVVHADVFRSVDWLADEEEEWWLDPTVAAIG